MLRVGALRYRLPRVLSCSTSPARRGGIGFIAFEDRGMHALKGVPGEWHLLAVAPSDQVIE
jgi:hypothetical protein